MIEDTESDTRIVSDFRERDREIKIITESTKIREGREKGEGSGEEMKGREVGITGEKKRRVLQLGPCLVPAYSVLQCLWPSALICSSSA